MSYAAHGLQMLLLQAFAMALLEEPRANHRSQKGVRLPLVPSVHALQQLHGGDDVCDDQLEHPRRVGTG